MTQTIEHLLKLADSNDADHREEAARGLKGYVLSPPVLKTLARLLGDSDWRVRRAAVESFVASGFEPISDLIFSALYEEENAGKRNAAIDVITRVGKLAVPFIGPHLQSENKDVRMFLINILGDLRDDTYLSAIQDAVRETDPNLSSAALLALGKIAAPAAKQILLESLETADPWLKFQAIEAAGAMQDPDAIDRLIGYLDTRLYRKVALKALGRFHNSEAYGSVIRAAISDQEGWLEALDALVDLYESVQPSVLSNQERRQIRNEWQQIVNETALHKLEERISTLDADDREKLFRVLNWNDRQSAETAGSEIQSPHTAGVDAELQESPGLEDPATVEMLLRASKDESGEVRSEAVRSMGLFPRPEFEHVLISALADEDARVRELAARSLRAYPDSPDAPLMSRMNDESVRVRIAAYESLASSGDATMVQAFTMRLPLETPPGQVALLKCCSRLEPEAGRDLALQYSYSGDAEVRKTACELMAESSVSSGNERLISLLTNDPDWRVRSAALQALAQQNRPELQTLLFERLDHETDPLLQKEILQCLHRFELDSLPEFLFKALLDKNLTDDAYRLLNQNKARHMDAIYKAAQTHSPDIRRILSSL